MAFLDNSGDILLDAVLTDTGRHRLAKGDGTFRITKFALGDDEINYGLYDKNNVSGSAYYDLNILQTPVLEAFTNNTSLMKSKLISIPRTNLLYLPILMANTLPTAPENIHFTDGVSSMYLVAVDSATEAKASTAAVMFGANVSVGRNMRVDQGLNTTEIPYTFPLDADLVETNYIVEVDNRFGSFYNKSGENAAKVSFIDDDQIASYYFSIQTDPSYVELIPDATTTDANTPILGPRGTTISLRIKASIDLNSSEFLFDQLGATVVYDTTNGFLDSSTYKYIDSTVRISGATTGYRIDVPVRFLKLESTP